MAEAEAEAASQWDDVLRQKNLELAETVEATRQAKHASNVRAQSAEEVTAKMSLELEEYGTNQEEAGGLLVTA